MIIYRTVNLINNHYYIGKDQRNDPKYLGSGIILARAIRKYGRDNFVKEVLEECDDSDTLAKRERYWIAYYDAVNDPTSYNIHHGGHGGNTGAYHKVGRRGAENPMYGKKHAPESIEKQKRNANLWLQSQEGIAHRQQTRDRMLGKNNWNYGKPMSAEAKEKLLSTRYHSRGKGYGNLATYRITSPDGKIYEIETKERLSTWCDKTGHSLWTIERRLLRGINPKSGSLVGWKAEVIQRNLKLPPSGS